MTTLSLRSMLVKTNTIKPSSIVRADRPSTHASKWNAILARRQELNKDAVKVSFRG